LIIKKKDRKEKKFLSTHGCACINEQVGRKTPNIIITYKLKEITYSSAEDEESICD
jgi:hypothetical protein